MSFQRVENFLFWGKKKVEILPFPPEKQPSLFPQNSKKFWKIAMRFCFVFSISCTNKPWLLQELCYITHPTGPVTHLVATHKSAPSSIGARQRSFQFGFLSLRLTTMWVCTALVPLQTEIMSIIAPEVQILLPVFTPRGQSAHRLYITESPP